MAGHPPAVMGQEDCAWTAAPREGMSLGVRFSPCVIGDLGMSSCLKGGLGMSNSVVPDLKWPLGCPEHREEGCMES